MSKKGDFENPNGRKDLSQTCIENISSKAHSNFHKLLFLTVEEILRNSWNYKNILKNNIFLHIVPGNFMPFPLT